jgi:CubicO group peptidase (beta-lactamase class C family)
MLTRRSAAVVLLAIPLALAPSWQALHAQDARKSTPSVSRTSGGRTPAALTAAPGPEALGFDAQRLARLDTYMAKAVADGRVAGMITLLARHGQIVSEKVYGYRSLATSAPMTRDTIFRLYSMTKPITGVAMMMLFEEGKWRLDDPITRFVPEFRGLKVMTGTDADGRMTLEDMKRPPTMRQLMSHSAGFGYGLGAEHPVDKLYREKGVLGANGLADMIARTAQIPLMYQPGTR